MTIMNNRDLALLINRVVINRCPTFDSQRLNIRMTCSVSSNLRFTLQEVTDLLIALNLKNIITKFDKSPFSTFHSVYTCISVYNSKCSIIKLLGFTGTINSLKFVESGCYTESFKNMNCSWRTHGKIRNMLAGLFQMVYVLIICFNNQDQDINVSQNFQLEIRRKELKIGYGQLVNGKFNPRIIWYQENSVANNYNLYLKEKSDMNKIRTYNMKSTEFVNWQRMKCNMNIAYEFVSTPYRNVLYTWHTNSCTIHITMGVNMYHKNASFHISFPKF